MTTARQTLAAAMTEDSLLTAVTEALTAHGWRWHHSRRSDKALTMGHPGFPDICAARNGRALFLELKTEKGRVAPEQREWLDAIDSPAVRAFVIRPSGLDWLLGRVLP